MDPNVLAIVTEAAAPAGRHVVHLSLQNMAEELVLIDPFNLCSEGGLRAPVFTITDSRGEKVKYIGRKYKRGEPQFDTFQRLKPGSVIGQDCELDSAYGFAGTYPPYKVQYAVLNMHPTLDYFRIRSEPLNTSF